MFGPILTAPVQWLSACLNQHIKTMYFFSLFQTFQNFTYVLSLSQLKEKKLYYICLGTFFIFHYYNIFIPKHIWKMYKHASNPMLFCFKSELCCNFALFWVILIAFSLVFFLLFLKKRKLIICDIIVASLVVWWSYFAHSCF